MAKGKNVWHGSTLKVFSAK